jgi:anti-sigma B factor antagonist
MKIKRDDEGPITVLRLQGKLMGGPEAEEFKTVVRELVTEGRKQVLVDLASVSWVNSTGLGILISNYTTLKSAGGTLKLVNTSQRIDQIFMVTKLNTIFESFDNETKALASFGS